MKFRNNIPFAGSLGLVAIMAVLTNTATATESNLEIKQPKWAFDTNIKNSNLVKPPTGHDRLSIQTLGVGIDSEGKIHAGLWGTMLHVPPNKGSMFGQLIDYGTSGGIGNSYTTISDQAGSAPVFDEKNQRAYFTTMSKSLIAVPINVVGATVLWKSPELDDGRLSMPALSQDGETIYLQGCKDPKGDKKGTPVFYAFSSSGDQKWRVEGVPGANMCDPDITPYAPVIDEQGRPYFTNYIPEFFNNKNARAIETVFENTEGKIERTGALEAYVAAGVPAILNNRLYFLGTTYKKEDGLLIAALQSAPAGVTLGKQVTTHVEFGNFVGVAKKNAMQSPVIAGNTAYMVDPYRGTVYAFALNQEDPTGKATKLWEFKPAELLPPSASIAANVSVTVSKNGIVYVTAGRHLHALDSNGKEQWRYQYEAITDENLAKTSVEIGAGIRTVNLGKHGEVYATACKDNSDKCGLLAFDGDGSPLAAPWGKVGGNAANTGHESEKEEVVPELTIDAKLEGPASLTYGSSVNLSAANSSASNGAQLRYEWIIPGNLRYKAVGSLINISSPNPSEDTPITVQVKVSSGGKTETVSHTLTALKRAYPLQARLEGPFAWSIIHADQLVVLSAEKSTGNNLSYKWSLPEGLHVTVTGGKIVFLAPALAQDTAFTFKVIVSDGQKTDTLMRTLNVKKQVYAPNTQTEGPATVDSGEQVQLSASQRNLNVVAPLEYFWIIPRNVTKFKRNGANLTFTAPNVKTNTTITLKLRVRSNSGHEQTVDHIVKVLKK
ncbi:hypothetical protein ACVBEF_00675 [Glaciimonas sp. GG7]